MTTDEHPARGVAVDRDVGRLLLRCPECAREMTVDRQPHDYPEAVRIQVTCDRCDKGDFAEEMQFDAEGRHITRDPDEMPNAPFSGERSESAGTGS